METRPRIVVVDDHPLLREGVVRTLEETGRFQVVGQGGSAADAVRLAGEHDPDLLLVDLSMPGGGLAAVAEVASRHPAVTVAVLTVSEADDDVMTALRSGARGYILKGIGSAALLEIVASLLAGESYVAPALAVRILTDFRGDRPGGRPADPLSTLTPREEQILALVGQGLSNKEIGRRLDLQEKTVKHHMTRILEKLQVRNRTEAALLARDHAPPAR